MGTKKMELMQFFDNCMKTDVNQVINIFVKMPDLPELEKISNPRENWTSKKSYYERAYNDDLELINNPVIRIVKWTGRTR